MKIGIVSTIAGSPTTPLDAVVEEAQRRELQGFAFYVVPSIFSLDAIGMLTVVGRETERIELIPAGADMSNDSTATATPVDPNGQVFGDYIQPTDIDWYRIDLPARSVLVVDVDALRRGERARREPRSAPSRTTT